MRTLPFTFLLLVATTLCAQQQFPAPKVAANALNEVTHSVTACPLGIAAHQQGAPQTFWTTSLEDQRNGIVHLDRKAGGYGIHVDLTQNNSANERADHIESITVQVFYVAPGTHAVLIGTPADHSLTPSIARTLSKTFRFDAFQANLLVGSASGITRVHLKQVNYADGHIWTADNPMICSTKPSMYVPVNAQ